MQTETTNPFKRKRMIGFDVLTLDTNSTYMLQLMELGKFQTKDGDTIDYATVVDLDTGMEKRLWLDGALKFKFESLKIPTFIEIEKLDKKEIEKMIDGKLQTVFVNDYKVFELEPA